MLGGPLRGLFMEYQPDLFRLLDLPPLRIARANRYGALHLEDCYWYRASPGPGQELVIGIGRTSAGFHSGFGYSCRGSSVGGPVFAREAFESAPVAFAAAAQRLLESLAVTYDKESEKHRKALLAFAKRTL